MTRNKIIILSISFLTILTILNYGSMFYNQLTGNPGTWVEFYQFKETDNLLSDILSVKQKNKQVCPPNDTIFSEDKNGWTYVPFYNDKIYYHVWVQGTTLVFSGTSTTSNYLDAQRINRDMSFITRQLTLKRFKNIVLDKLTLKLPDS
ncbi:MAG: hypothetical protein JNK73_04045 [Bacteroidia bacterium]|nr:hypothetical protein [Bacteroidia bacterium]